jgi:hypothetical protein
VTRTREEVLKLAEDIGRVLGDHGITDRMEVLVALSFFTAETAIIVGQDCATFLATIEDIYDRVAAARRRNIGVT